MLHVRIRQVRDCTPCAGQGGGGQRPSRGDRKQRTVVTPKYAQYALCYNTLRQNSRTRCYCVVRTTGTPANYKISNATLSTAQFGSPPPPTNGMLYPKPRTYCYVVTLLRQRLQHPVPLESEGSRRTARNRIRSTRYFCFTCLLLSSSRNTMILQ